MDFGFLVSAGAAGVAVEIYGEYTALVNWARRGADVAVIVGRLHYTEALGARTGSPEPEPAGRSDAELALGCYQRAGVSGFEELEGDFAVVVWDGRRRRFVGRRDPLGGYPLFWTRAGGTTAFATGLAPLVALLPTHSLDPGQLAEGLLAGSNGRERNEASVYAGISRVLADTIVTVDPDRGFVQRHRYWDWREQAVDPGRDRLPDLASRYRELLVEAVRQRMIGISGAELSEGLTRPVSASLPSAWYRPAGGRSAARLLTRLRGAAGSGQGAALRRCRCRRGPPQLVHHRLPGDDLLDFDGFTDPPPHRADPLD